MAQDALILYAINQSFYRLEHLLWKRFSNTRKTFAIQRCMLTFSQRYRKARIPFVETFLEPPKNVCCLTLQSNVSTTLQRMCECDISYRRIKVKDVPLYYVTQCQMAQDALILYAINQFSYRLEHLLWKRFSNPRNTFVA